MRYILPLLLIFSIVLQAQRADFRAIDFEKADSVAFMLKGESLKNLPVLTHKLIVNLATDVEKFRAIYTWVSTNIENDYSAYLKTRSKRKKLAKNREAFLKWNNSFTPKVFQKLVSQKKTACTGYAYLIRELATLANLNCKIINGYGRTATLNLDQNSIPNHSWNAIELNSKWYLCDATWSAGRVIIEDDGPKFESDYHDGYFLAEPALFVKNHYPLKAEWILVTNPPTFNEFLEGPVIYKEAFEPKVIPIAPKKMQLETVKNESISFIISIPDTVNIDSISLVLNNGGSNQNIQPKITRNQNQYILQHSFEKAGTYDVHIKVGEAIVGTYVLKVKRK